MSIKLTVTQTREKQLPARYRGAEVTIIQVDDPERFARGEVGAMVRFADPTATYQGGKPIGVFYIDEMDPAYEAERQARDVADSPTKILECAVGTTQAAFVTSRGPFHLTLMGYGVKYPSLPPNVMTEIVEIIKRGLAT